MTDDIPPYIPPPPTKYTLDYAPLMTLDLTTFHDSADERMRLARQLADATHNTGFWVVTGHGISDDDIKRQLALGQAFFKRPIEEKREYPCDFENGKYVSLFFFSFSSPSSPPGRLHHFCNLAIWVIARPSALSLIPTSGKTMKQYAPCIVLVA